MTQGLSINELKDFSLLKKDAISLNLSKKSLSQIGLSIKSYMKEKDWLSNLIKKSKKEWEPKHTDLLKINNLVRSDKQPIKSNICDLPPINHKSRSSASKTLTLSLNSNKRKKKNASERKGKSLVNEEITSLECFKISAYQNILLDIQTLKTDIKFVAESKGGSKRSSIGLQNYQVTLRKQNKFKEFINESEETSKKDCMIILARKKPIISRLTPIIDTEKKTILSARVDVPNIKIGVNEAEPKGNLPQPISRMVISTNKKIMCDAWTDVTEDKIFKFQKF